MTNKRNKEPNKQPTATNAVEPGEPSLLNAATGNKDCADHETDDPDKQIRYALQIIRLAGLWVRAKVWAKVPKGSVFWTAAATIVIAATTILQWVAIKGQLREMQETNITYRELIYRPYIGVNGMGAAFYFFDRGVEHPTPQPTPETNAMAFNAEIKNFGPIPGIQYTGRWRVFLGEREVSPYTKIPDKPINLFPERLITSRGKFWAKTAKMLSLENKSCGSKSRLNITGRTQTAVAQTYVTPNARKTSSRQGLTSFLISAHAAPQIRNYASLLRRFRLTQWFVAVPFGLASDGQFQSSRINRLRALRNQAFWNSGFLHVGPRQGRASVSFRHPAQRR